MSNERQFDLLIIGAGPAGLSSAYAAARSGLDYIVIDKGLIANTIYNYPVGLTVFSTTDELEFEPGDLKPAREKPTREELLSYYVRTVLDNDLNVRTEERVVSVAANAEGGFKITTDRAAYSARNVLFAIGAMDYPRRLNVPGEDLPHVYDHFRETYPWVRKNVLIVGGGNSAGEAALFLAREGANTTLAIYREDWENSDPKQGCIKYWVKQPLEDERKRGCLDVFFLGSVIEIGEDRVLLKDDQGRRVELASDAVFVLIGADADLSMLRSVGVETRNGKYGDVPVYDPETFETNVKGIYVAGHFTDQRHIKGAIDAGKALVRHIAAASVPVGP